MANYSVAEAKNRLPSLIDKAAAGEEVVITRHGKPVVELRPTERSDGLPRTPGAYERLIATRGKGPKVSVTSVQLLNDLYEEDDR